MFGIYIYVYVCAQIRFVIIQESVDTVWLFARMFCKNYVAGYEGKTVEY